MKGLALSRAYFSEAIRPILAKRVTEIGQSYAAALLGWGSDVLGNDDALSRTTMGPGACCSCPNLHSAWENPHELNRPCRRIKGIDPFVLTRRPNGAFPSQGLTGHVTL